MYKISVVIPIFNMEKYLRFCLETVRKQTFFQNLEVICVNDGSTDLSLHILKEYADKYKNFKILNQKNQGVGIARNHGMKAATGEFIAFMDPDDYYLHNHTLELLYTKAKEHKVQICGGSLSEDHNDGTWIRKEFEGIYKKYTFHKEGIIRYQDYQFDFGFFRFIYQREFLLQNQIFFPPLIRFQDPPFFVHAMIEAKEFYAVTDETYCYRYGHQKLVWHEERICALIKGHIENLKLSKDAGLGELHALTLHRLFEISADCLAHGLAQESIPVWELLQKTEKYIDPALLSAQGKTYSFRQFVFNYCKQAEQDQNDLHKMKKEIAKLHQQSAGGKCRLRMILKKIHNKRNGRIKR